MVYWKTQFIQFLDIGDHECILCVLPGDGGVQEVGACDAVIHPYQHMEVQRPALLKL